DFPGADQLVAAGEGLALHADPLEDSRTHRGSVLAGFVHVVDRRRLPGPVAPRPIPDSHSDPHQAKTEPAHTEELRGKKVSGPFLPLAKKGPDTFYSVSLISSQGQTRLACGTAAPVRFPVVRSALPRPTARTARRPPSPTARIARSSRRSRLAGDAV